MRACLAVLASILALAACSAALVAESKDPKTKLDQARELLGTNRPIPAERLVREAATIYEERKDLSGQADASMLYGVMLQTSTYRSYEKFWVSTGKYDPTNKTAIQYMEKALLLYSKAADVEGQRWASLELAKTYLPDGQKDRGCALLGQVRTYNATIAKSGEDVGTETSAAHFNRWEKMTTDIQRAFSCA